MACCNQPDNDVMLKLKQTPFNIMVTGTPGVGKSRLSSYLAKILNKTHLDISEISIFNNLTSGYDKKLESHFIDEDMINEHIDRVIHNSSENSNGVIIDYHGVDFYDHPEMINAIIVVTAHTSNLKKRYTERGYNDDKIKNNIECELFRMLFEEAFEYAQDENKILEFPSNDDEDFHELLVCLLEKLYKLVKV